MSTQPGVVWLAGGIACMAGTAGFMVGASNSPVAGVAITAAFGVVATGVGVLYNQQLNARLAITSRDAASTDRTSLITPDGLAIQLQQIPAYLGQALVVCALSLLVGTLVGAYSRIALASSRTGQVSSPVPWTAANAPETAYEAVDWLVSAGKLRALGYDDPKIADVYAIRAAEKIRAAQTSKGLLSFQPQPISPLLSGVTVGSDFSKMLVYEPSIIGRTQGAN